MEHRNEWPLERPAVRMRFHEVARGVPPSAHDRVLRQRFPTVFRFQLEHREQVQRFLIEEDRIVMDACIREQLRELGPDGIMAALVLGYLAGLELHAEGMVHSLTSLGATVGLASTFISAAAPDARDR